MHLSQCLNSPPFLVEEKKCNKYKKEIKNKKLQNLRKMTNDFLFQILSYKFGEQKRPIKFLCHKKIEIPEEKFFSTKEIRFQVFFN